MNKKIKIRSAFSMIELILYVAISSIIVVAMLSFSIRIVEVRGETEFDREVSENTRFIMDYISREIRDADGVNTGTYGVNPSSITLNTDGGGTMVLNTTTKVVNGKTITVIQSNNGSGAIQLTSDKVDVTNYVFTNLLRGTEPDNIQFELTITSYDASAVLSVRTANSLRE